MPLREGRYKGLSVTYTGKACVKLWWFGTLRFFVQVELHDGSLIWKRATQSEINWAWPPFTCKGKLT